MKKMYKLLLSLLVTATAASAVSDYDMNMQLKAGVLNNAYMSSDQEKAELNKLPNAERSQFVTADLGFHFRPYDAVRFNAILRFEAGMQNYFASSAKSISVPWLNVEGNVGRALY